MLFNGMGVEFKDKIMLCCFSEVKCKHGFTTEIWYYLYNPLSLTLSMCISDQMVNESENRCDHPGRFPGRGSHEFIFQFYWIWSKSCRNTLPWHECSTRECTKRDAAMVGGNKLSENSNQLLGLVFDGTTWWNEENRLWKNENIGS